jgi:hypothetical protein
VLDKKLSSRVPEFMRSRAGVALLLLALTAHAFVAGATHFHGLTSPFAPHAPTAFQNGEERGQSQPLGGDEKQCLVCRLQRNFVSTVQQATILLAAPSAWAPVYADLKDVSASAARTLLRPGRAPPSARA